MVFDWHIILAVFICFIFGSIPFPLVITYMFTRTLLFKVGTGNIGIANAFGFGGLWCGLLSVGAAATQAALPILLNNYWIKADVRISLMLLVVTILGAQYSPFVRKKSINAGSIFLWGLLLLSPVSLMLFGLIFGTLFIFSRNTRVTTLLGYLFLPAELWLVERTWPFLIFGVFIALMYAFRYDPSRSEYKYYRGRHWSSWLFEKRLLYPLRSATNPAVFGAKATNLRRLVSLGANVPTAWVCCIMDIKRIEEGDETLKIRLEEELTAILDRKKVYVVRSSSSTEDGRDFSFAGQFESYLNLSQPSEIIQAIMNIMESTLGEKVKSYQNKTEPTRKDIGMAIIVQEMVSAQLAGVVFTCNPVTALSETIVEGVWGSGESLMQYGHTPMRWIFKWGNLVESTSTGDNELDNIARNIAEEAGRYAAKIGNPLDLEWAWDGESVHWLQARNITGIDGLNIYSNRISREFLPGMIRPLVWSINTSVVNTAWKELFSELIGKRAQNIEVNKLTKAFYYRSYFNMGIIGDIFELLGMPRESMELLLGIENMGPRRPSFRPGWKVLRYVPRMLLFLVKHILFTSRLHHELPRLYEKYQELSQENLDAMDIYELSFLIDKLIDMNIQGSSYVIISRLMASIYDVVARRTMGNYDWQYSGDRKFKKLAREIDPAFQFNLLKQRYQEGSDAHGNEFHDNISKQGSGSSKQELFEKQLELFIHKFGHLSDSGNDFSRVQWQEDPNLIRNMLVGDSTASVKTIDKQEGDGSLSRKSPNFFGKSLIRRATETKYLRARSNYIYEYGYSLFRRLFLSIGATLVKENILKTPEDIFYLYLDELKEVITEVGTGLDRHEIAIRRREEMKRFEKLILPSTIIGDEIPLPVENHDRGDVIKGVAVSRGYHEGTLRVVKSLKDFSRVNQGDVVAIPYSDVSWTPMLARVGAIISESGGMLSHCSIVAREYGIPAVVSVDHAMSLDDGIPVAVNGLTGEVFLL